MRTLATLKKIKITKPEMKLPSQAVSLLKQFACLAGALLLSSTVITGNLSPFGIALCAAIHPKYMISALIGSGIGSFLAGSVLSPYRYLGAVIGALLLSWAIFSFCSRKMRRILPPCNAFACSLFTGLILCAAEGFALQSFLLMAAESVLAAGAAYFFQKTFTVLVGHKALRTLPLRDIAPVLISVSILLMGLQVLDVGDFSPVRLCCVFFILIAGRYGGVTGGALAGILLGLSMGLSGDMFFLTGVYGVGGVMAGLFSPMGQAGACGALVVSCVMSLALAGSMAEVLPLLLEVAAGCLLFLLLPRNVCNRVDRYFNSSIDISPSGDLRDSLVVKLRFAGNTMSGISQSIHSVNEKLRELSVPGHGTLNKNLAKEICSGCNLKELCWKKEGALTIEGFRSLWRTVQQEGQLTPHNLPATFEERCIHTDRLIQSYNHHYQAFCRKESFENEVGHLREIVADQLEGMSDMLFDLSSEFEQAEVYDANASEKVKQILLSYGITPGDVCCVTDKFQRLRVEAHCPQPVPDLNNRKMHQQIAAACGRKFEDVNVTLAGHEALLTYAEKARLALYVGTAQHASGGATLCGDSVEVINDNKGHQILVISDGMGTGPDAAIEGALAAGMLARLLKGGFGFDCSLHTVNSALLVKSGEESLATLDVVSVDLFNGRAEFYKAGASSSFLLKEGKAWKVELPSLPAGILRDVEFAKTSAFLNPGDKVILFSDGVADSDTRWLGELLEKEGAQTTPQALAERVVQEARRRATGAREDDMTVVVGELQKNL